MGVGYDYLPTEKKMKKQKPLSYERFYVGDKIDFEDVKGGILEEIYSAGDGCIIRVRGKRESGSKRLYNFLYIPEEFRINVHATKKKNEICLEKIIKEAKE